MKDLKIPKIETRKTKGMKDFFIFILVYSYYNTEYIDDNNSFILSETMIAEYYNKSVRSVNRWFKKLRDLGYLQYTKRDDAGEIGYYTIKEDGKLVTKSYTKGNNKKKVIRDKTGNLRGCLNIYQLDQKSLNTYLVTHINTNVLNNISQYKNEFDNYMSFITSRKDTQIKEELENKVDKKVVNKSKVNRKDKIRYNKLNKKLLENSVYIEKKKLEDSIQPEFACKYLDNGCFRLTHDICNTINPEHLDKINENNYWRSSDCRLNMLKGILHTSKSNIIEYDVNGSIYRLTYNLYHDEPLADNVDIYKLIWDNCGFDVSWRSSKIRTAFKAILMPIYMKCSTINFKSRQWEFIDKHNNLNNISKIKREFYLLHKRLVDVTKISIKSLLETIKNALFKTLNINKSMGADVFIQESNLHILMREKFIERGIYSANVYDGFYFDKNDMTEKEFYAIYREATIELKNNLKLGIGSPIPA